jgi:iron complex transport system substrate-binding protein
MSLSISASVQVVDDTGQTVYLKNQAKRVISLAPSVTEILFKIGVGHSVIGMVKGSDYPREALAVQRVGDYAHFDLERIVALKPDLIVASSYNPLHLVNLLKQLDIPVYIIAPKRIQDIATDMQQLGSLTGAKSEADKQTKIFLSRLEKLRQRYKNKQKVRVFYQIWDHPMMTTNKKSLVGEVIELCGGENIFGNVFVSYPVVSLESIVDEDPDVIFTSSLNMSSQWKQLRVLSAVQSNRIYLVSPDVIQRDSPRILEGATQICGLLDRERSKILKESLF